MINRWMTLRGAVGVAFLALAACALSDANAASRREIAAAPVWVRSLHCRNLISADAKEIHAGERFRGWFEGTMAPIADRGANMDELYAMLLTLCSKDQDWGVIDAVMGVREMMAAFPRNTR
jgi:hypothetical protein